MRAGLAATLLGYNVTLPCLFSGYDASKLAPEKLSVRWILKTSLTEKSVYEFNGGSIIQARPWSYIQEDRLLRGDASLYIPNLVFGDEGEYTCHLIVTPEKAISTVTLLVSAKPTCRLSHSRLDVKLDIEGSVLCYLDGFHPIDVNIQGVRYSKASANKSELNVDTWTKAPVQNQDGTYNVTAVMSVTPRSREEDGDVYSFIISHRSLKDDLTCNFTLSVQPGIYTFYNLL
ncbi:hypothetical protein GDO81_022469 [Engystomops pustulosus]|uniref:Ig-like domain-containing protein n=1 Tax=Engystomops pustulosus TaxID=76066 RepID=A0AAV6ZAP5_ENGPU|nr:hypothetical protein GDO81_026606 [Engystomops pustulosus]KAG8544454.1 hypothetical protein GDO81_022469 [Engystomops pustulosus]